MPDLLCTVPDICHVQKTNQLLFYYFESQIDNINRNFIRT